MKKPLIVLTGPTAAGKTHLSIALAKAVGGEIISADSMQVYKHMDIGSAKPSYEEIKKYNYKMIDIVEPFFNFNIKDYLEIFKNVIENVDKAPIFGVGGTGFYIDSIKYGIFDETNDNKENSIKIRKELYQRIENEGLESLYLELLKVDKESAEIIDRYNSRRVIRALEVFYNTGRKFSELKKERKKIIDLDYLSYIMDIERDTLYNNINKRVDLMFDNGLLEEVKSIIKMNVNINCTSMQAIGYKECYDYLVNNSMSFEDLKEIIKKRTRNFAKRQLTWFRREEHKRIKPEDIEKVAKEIKEFYEL
mgnify:CR=1 FL=1